MGPEGMAISSLLLSLVEPKEEKQQMQEQTSYRIRLGEKENEPSALFHDLLPKSKKEMIVKLESDLSVKFVLLPFTIFPTYSSNYKGDILSFGHQSSKR